MGYSKALYEQAARVLSERRMAAESRAAVLRARAIEKDPRLAEIEQKLAGTGVRLAQTVLVGLDGDEAGAKAAFSALQSENLALQNEMADRLHLLGESADNFEPQPFCKVCGDTGYAGAKLCGCFTSLLQAGACRELSSLSGMTLTRFEDMDMTYYSAVPDKSGLSPRQQMEDVVAYCRDWAEDFSEDSPSLLFRGPTGTGKTHLSLAIAKAVAEQGATVLYGSVQRLLRQVEREHFGKEDGDSLARFGTCDLLILDDLGTEFASPFYTAALYDILNERILSGRPTILSTNLNGDQLRERYGAQIASRITGCFETILFAGSDVRALRRRRAENDD